MFGWTIRPRLYENGISEAYLSDMAAKGWYLKRLGWNLILFKKGAPAKVRYAVDVIGKGRRRADEKPDSSYIQEYLHACEENGWRFVDSDSTFYVFTAKDESVVPMQTDPAGYEHSVFLQRKRSLLTLLFNMAVLFFVIGRILFAPYYYMARKAGPAMWLTGALVAGNTILRLGYALWVTIRENGAISKGQVPKAVHGRRITWIIFSMEEMALITILIAWSQILELNAWMFVPGALLALFLFYIAQEWLIGAGWQRFLWLRSRLAWVRALGIVLICAAIYLIPVMLKGEGLFPIRAQEPPEGWQPVITAADFGWSSDPTLLSYNSSWCAQEYEMWEGSGTEQIRSVVYASKIDVLLDSFYKKGPSYGEWWNEEGQIQEQSELDADLMGLEAACCWQTESNWQHYLLRAGDRVLYLMVRQELTDEQLVLAADRLLASASEETP